MGIAPETNKLVKTALGTNELGKTASGMEEPRETYTVLDIVTTTRAENTHDTILLKHAKELR